MRIRSRRQSHQANMEAEAAPTASLFILYADLSLLISSPPQSKVNCVELVQPQTGRYDFIQRGASQIY